MESDANGKLRSELEAVAPGGDLIALADELRHLGVDSLLVCRPGGRIETVVSEHRIRRLAQPIQPGLPYVPDQPHIPDQPYTPELAEGEGIGAQAR